MTRNHANTHGAEGSRTPDLLVANQKQAFGVARGGVGKNLLARCFWGPLAAGLTERWGAVFYRLGTRRTFPA